MLNRRKFLSSAAAGAAVVSVAPEILAPRVLTIPPVPWAMVNAIYAGDIAIGTITANKIAVATILSPNIKIPEAFR